MQSVDNVKIIYLMDKKKLSSVYPCKTRLNKLEIASVKSAVYWQANLSKINHSHICFMLHAINGNQCYGNTCLSRTFEKLLLLKCGN